MTLNEIEINCLNSACDDYENMKHINESVDDALGKKTPENSVIEALKHLLQLKLMDGFVFDRNKQTYNRVDPRGAYDMNDLWFATNDSGQKHLDLHWKEEPK